MAHRDRWSAAGLGLLAAGYLLAARDYPLDTLAAPGPGVFPVAAGILLAGLAFWQFVVAGRHAPATPPPAAVGARRSAALALAALLVAYAAALPRLGFGITSFALVVAAARLMGLPGWWRPGLLALGVTAVSRLLFVHWLGVPLP
jgi:putative tricarboxylic transport membrane protein